MRMYILTQKERKTLEAFINSGAKLDGFSVLKLRLKKAKTRLEKDLKIIQLVLEKER